MFVKYKITCFDVFVDKTNKKNRRVNRKIKKCIILTVITKNSTQSLVGIGNILIIL